LKHGNVRWLFHLPGREGQVERERHKFHRKNRVGVTGDSWQSERVNDYERIARIIRFLNARHVEQPDLTMLAERAGLSPFHFHRLFVTWAGVTPKDFLQCLTLAHAKELLRNGGDILDAALESGLSGPGRLHDLCVNLEAASPGELKSGGAGWTILFGFAESPFGKCLIAESPRGICHLSFVDDEKTSLAELQEDWPQANWKRDNRGASRLAARIFARSGASERPHNARSSRRQEDHFFIENQDRRLLTSAATSLRVFVRGTPFQVRVWRALLQVQPGSLISYGRLAGAIGRPKAARALGTAIGQNPLAYLIPCHRVIRETGVIGDYRWGADRKRTIIAWESLPRVAGTLEK
jgi:AraC family transcriptional regulator, regulatory protein of adaptative response / methylated-DNA-[protein]-cysteine methyltransferase